MTQKIATILPENARAAKKLDKTVTSLSVGGSIVKKNRKNPTTLRVQRKSLRYSSYQLKRIG